MILGIDIGGTKCAAVSATNSGKIEKRREVDTHAEEGAAAVITRLIEAAREVCGSQKPACIGISCGGPLDTKAGVVFEVPNLPGWENMPLKLHFEKAFPGAEVLLENDANATALAEWKFGAGRGTRNMVFLTMGTGIGGGLILDGRLYKGTNDLAGEVGHQTIKVNGPLCGCGKRGCLEALASGPAIARMAQESTEYGRGKPLIARAGGRVKDITARHVIEAAKDGDAYSKSILEEAGGYMGIGLANIIQILNPEKIVLGTIAVHAGDLILEPIRKSVEEYAWKRSREVSEIVPAELGDRAQDMAAIALVAEL
jgi:Transcriptional regulator/sugar kinase